MDSYGSVVAEYLHITPLSPILLENKASSEMIHVPVEPPDESANASITIIHLQSHQKVPQMFLQ